MLLFEARMFWMTPILLVPIWLPFFAQDGPGSGAPVVPSKSLGWVLAGTALLGVLVFLLIVLG